VLIGYTCFLGVGLGLRQTECTSLGLSSINAQGIYFALGIGSAMWHQHCAVAILHYSCMPNTNRWTTDPVWRAYRKN